MNYLYSHNMRCANCNSLCFFITELTWVLNTSFLPKVENKPIQDNWHFSFKHGQFRIWLLFCSLFPGVIYVSGSREEVHLADSVVDSGVLSSAPTAPMACDLGLPCGFHLPGQCCWLSLCPSGKAYLPFSSCPLGHIYISLGEHGNAGGFLQSTPGWTGSQAWSDHIDTHFQPLLVFRSGTMLERDA